jgi:hypothetical protein
MVEAADRRPEVPEFVVNDREAIMEERGTGWIKIQLGLETQGWRPGSSPASVDPIGDR